MEPTTAKKGPNGVTDISYCHVLIIFIIKNKANLLNQNEGKTYVNQKQYQSYYRTHTSHKQIPIKGISNS